MDLVAVAQDDRLAAFCVGWIWQDKSGETSGQIEPMGVHGDYRQWAWVGPSEAVGFRVAREILVYRKDSHD